MDGTLIDFNTLMDDVDSGAFLQSTETISYVIIKEEEPVRRGTYCYKCHRGIRYQLQCSTCIRIFHFKCVALSLKTNLAGFFCEVCTKIAQEKSKEPRISRDRLSRILEYVIDQITSDIDSSKSVQLYKPKSLAGYPKRIVFPIGFDDMKLKISEEKYETVQEFLEDIRWIHHNSYIINGGWDYFTGQAKTAYTRATKQFAKMWNCIECYENELTASENSFSSVCTEPHVLGWAKVTGYRYWPCKVLKVDGTDLEVYFFGTHVRSRVPASDCHVFFEEKPNNIRVTKQMMKALGEVELYVKNVMEKYGVFNYAPATSETLFDPAKDSCYRKFMLTGTCEHNLLEPPGDHTTRVSPTAENVPRTSNLSPSTVVEDILDDEIFSEIPVVVPQILDADKREPLKNLEISNNQLMKRLQVPQSRSKREDHGKRCSNCGIRADFHCCSSGYYCGLKCQKDHWKVHYRNCKQKTESNRYK